MAQSTLIAHKYQVESLLGKGSMGEVYKVRHIALGTVSALKVLPSHLMGNPDLVTRFYREARVMAKLIHPNIVRVTDIDHDKELNFHFIVMEFIQGQSLRECMNEKKTLSLEATLKLGKQIASALDLAHKNSPQVIHRDIKPANIMVEDNTHRTVLMDFGIAKEMDEVDLSRGLMLGTVRYSPREQLLCEDLDGRADVYALGMVMYETYTGNHIFAGLSENQVISQVLGDKEELPEFPAHTPKEFVNLISKAVAKHRDNRYKSSADFITDLDTCWRLHFNSELPNSSNETIDDLDEHIQKLEQERERRLVKKSKDKCDEEKGNALKEKADHTVTDVFLEATQHEKNGIDFLNQAEYIKAKDAFETAAKLFFNAFQQAQTIGLKRQAEQIEHQVRIIRSQSDFHDAIEKASALYEQALDFNSQAGKMMERSDYKEAYELYRQAYQHFSEASKLANLKSQQDESEALLVQANAAANQAIVAQARELVPSLYNEALESQQKAESMFKAEEFSIANELFQTVIAMYTEAKEKSVFLKHENLMLATKNEAVLLLIKAEKAGASRVFIEEYEKAKELQSYAQRLEENQKPEQAAAYYKKAAKSYESLLHETELLEAREQGDLLKQQLSKIKINHVNLRNWAIDAWVDVETLTEEADTVWGRQQYPEALRLYKEALEKHAIAEQKSLAAKNIEQAKNTRAQLNDLQKCAEYCQAQHHALDIYQKAVHVMKEGDTLLESGNYEDVLKCYQSAKMQFEKVFSLRNKQLQKAVCDSKEKATEKKALIYAVSLYEQGESLLTSASRLWMDGHFEESYDAYIKAGFVFEDAYKQSCQQHEKEKAEDLKNKVQKAAEDATRVDAHELSSSLYEQAVQNLNQADAALMAEDYTEATQIYIGAKEKFNLAEQQSLEYIKKQALFAQEQANQFKKAAELAPTLHQLKNQPANEFYRLGLDFLNQQNFKSALQSFEQAQTKFQEIANEIENVRLYQEMLATKAKAEVAHQQSEQGNVEHYFKQDFNQTVQILERAQNSSESKDFAKAASLYEKAMQCFLKLNSDTEVLLIRQKIENRLREVLEIEALVKPIKKYANTEWGIAQQFKAKAEKASHAQDYKQVIELYDKAYTTFTRAKLEAEENLGLLKQAQQEKRLIAKRRWATIFPIIKRGLTIGTIAFFIAYGSYRMMTNPDIQKWLSHLSMPALTISALSPDISHLSLQEGQSQEFSLEINDKEKLSAQYSWLYDGKEMSTENKWTFRPSLADQKTSPNEIKVVITDKYGRFVENFWEVNVTEDSKRIEEEARRKAEIEIIRKTEAERLAAFELQRKQSEARSIAEQEAQRRNKAERLAALETMRKAKAEIEHQAKLEAKRRSDHLADLELMRKAKIERQAELEVHRKAQEAKQRDAELEAQRKRDESRRLADLEVQRKNQAARLATEKQNKLKEDIKKREGEAAIKQMEREKSNKNHQENSDFIAPSF